jgi:hypothetical protein
MLAAALYPPWLPRLPRLAVLAVVLEVVILGFHLAGQRIKTKTLKNNKTPTVLLSCERSWG